MQSYGRYGGFRGAEATVSPSDWHHKPSQAVIAFNSGPAPIMLITRLML